MPFPGGLEALLLALPRLKLQYARLQYYWTPLSALDAGALNATLLLRWPVPAEPGQYKRVLEYLSRYGMR